MTSFLPVLLTSIFFMLGCADISPHSFAKKIAIQDHDHLKEHLKNKLDADAMTADRARFHYFWINDLNHDSMLDGLEIIKSLTHTHDAKQGPILSDEKIEELVDGTLKQMDLDNNGYIDFAEYSKVAVTEE